MVRPQQGVAVAGPVLPTEVAEGEEAPPDKPRAEVIRIAVGDIQAGELEKNLFLQPNDTVFVPQAPKVFVSGEVKSPGAYGWFPGMTTRQLISRRGRPHPGRLRRAPQGRPPGGRQERGRQDQARRAREARRHRRRPPPPLLASAIPGSPGRKPVTERSSGRRPVIPRSPGRKPVIPRRSGPDGRRGIRQRRPVRPRAAPGPRSAGPTRRRSRAGGGSRRAPRRTRAAPRP